jgi:ribose 5-phosphate isomerase B
MKKLKKLNSEQTPSELTHQIILASDHAGFALKEAVKKYLDSEFGGSHSIVDVGATELVDGDDYPVYMSAAALKVAEDLTGNTRAIIFGGSGQGEAIVANRFPGVRACVWYGGNEEVVEHSRKDNDSNVLSLGARFIDEKTACHVVELWINTPFSGEERHKRRIEQIDAIE